LELFFSKVLYFVFFVCLGLQGLTVASNSALKIEAIEPGTYEEYKLDENEKAEFVKKERFHSIGKFPKYDVNVNLTGK
jgi:hypothetical protein